MKCRLCGLEGPLFKDGTCRGDGCELRQAENEADALRAELAALEHTLGLANQNGAVLMEKLNEANAELAEVEEMRDQRENQWSEAVSRMTRAEAELARARGLLERCVDYDVVWEDVEPDINAFLAGTAPPAPLTDEQVRAIQEKGIRDLGDPREMPEDNPLLKALNKARPAPSAREPCEHGNVYGWCCPEHYAKARPSAASQEHRLSTIGHYQHIAGGCVCMRPAPPPACTCTGRRVLDKGLGAMVLEHAPDCRAGWVCSCGSPVGCWHDNEP